jgi:ubiquinol-cytochrome c reductase cytochrome b subunit
VASKWRNWVVDRFAWEPIRQHALDRRVAKGSWYFGDGATLLLLLGVLVVTGMVMVLTYSPNPDAAYQSVEYITREQTLGWFVRGLHYWTAGFMVIMLFFHLFRQILLGGYKSPRQGTWLIGVLLFFCVLAMAYTGYLLRWDERAIYGIKVGLHMLNRVPWIGEGIVVFIQGGPELGARTLTRIYAIHVMLVPLMLFLLVGYHLYLVIYHGVTSKSERERPVHSAEEQRQLYKADAHSTSRGETFYPETAARSGVMAIVVFGLAVALTLIRGPQDLQPEANLVERSYPYEEWWFWWYSSLIALLPKYIAPWFVVVFPILVFLFLVLLPALDRGPYRGIRNRPVAAICVAACVIGLLYLTDLRRKSSWTGWPQANPPKIPERVILTDQVEEGRLLFAAYGCNTCHPIAGYGPNVGTDFAIRRGAWSRAELRAYILHPPRGVPMPSYAGRLHGADLERVVEFVHAAQTFPRERRARDPGESGLPGDKPGGSD